MNELIKIRRVVDGKPAMEAKPATRDTPAIEAQPETTSKVEIETICLDDIISFRKWYKGGKDMEVDGPFIQLTLISHGKQGGMWTTRVQESEEKFTERIKEFRPVIDFA